MKVIIREEQFNRVILKEQGEYFKSDDAYWAQAKEDLTCKDCKEWTAADEDMFMVNDEIWDEYGNKKDMLCPGCLEKRMGRKLKKGDVSDYSDAPVNIENPYIQNLTEGWYDEEDTYYSGDYADKGDEGLGEKIMLVRELQDEIDELMSVIPYTETKDEAYDIQEDILELEDRVNGLQWEIENNI